MKHNLVQFTLELLTDHYLSTHKLTLKPTQSYFWTKFKEEPVRDELLSEFGISASHLVNSWTDRVSDFEFMESSFPSLTCQKSVELLQVFRTAELLRQQLLRHQTERDEQGLRLYPIFFWTLATNETELILIESLLDSIPDQVEMNDRKLKNQLADTLDQLRKFLDQTSQNLYLQTVVSSSSSSNVVNSSLTCDLDSYLIELNQSVNTQEVLEVSLIKHPCQSVMMNDWIGFFGDEWITPCIHNYFDQTNGFSDLYIELEKVWSDSPYFEQLWNLHLLSYCQKALEQYLKQIRTDDIMSDVTQCFITLIDMKRPKDQRIGSFWINEEDPSQITVIFLTRDGRLLAQRDITWNPHDSTSVLKAFERINIKTLTYPIHLTQTYPELLAQLRSRYQLKGVSAVALDPNHQVPQLKFEAYGALRIGQRYVTPLRFWGRADLLELTRNLVAPEIFECLERSGHLHQISQKLQDHCSERWLNLRKNRQNRQQNEQNQTNEPTKPQRSYTRGDLVEAYIVDQDQSSLKVVTVGDARRGYVKLNSTVKRALSQLSQSIKIGDCLTFTVLGEHPSQGTLILTLYPRDSNTNYPQHHSSTDRSEQDKSESTLSRINDLFYPNSNQEIHDHSSHQEDQHRKSSSKSKRNKTSQTHRYHRKLDTHQQSSLPQDQKKKPQVRYRSN